jgi:hypothetical protein
MCGKVQNTFLTGLSRDVHGPGIFQGVFAACSDGSPGLAGLEGLGLGIAMRQSGIFLTYLP